jgi:hypothetical protein
MIPSHGWNKSDGKHGVFGMPPRQMSYGGSTQVMGLIFFFNGLIWD